MSHKMTPAERLRAHLDSIDELEKKKSLTTELGSTGTFEEPKLSTAERTVKTMNMTEWAFVKSQRQDDTPRFDKNPCWRRDISPSQIDHKRKENAKLNAMLNNVRHKNKTPNAFEVDESQSDHVTPRTLINHARQARLKNPNKYQQYNNTVLSPFQYPADLLNVPPPRQGKHHTEGYKSADLSRSPHKSHSTMSRQSESTLSRSPYRGHSSSYRKLSPDRSLRPSDTGGYHKSSSRSRRGESISRTDHSISRRDSGRDGLRKERSRRSSERMGEHHRRSSQDRMDRRSSQDRMDRRASQDRMDRRSSQDRMGSSHGGDHHRRSSQDRIERRSSRTERRSSQDRLGSSRGGDYHRRSSQDRMDRRASQDRMGASQSGLNRTGGSLKQQSMSKSAPKKTVENSTESLESPRMEKLREMWTKVE